MAVGVVQSRHDQRAVEVDHFRRREPVPEIGEVTDVDDVLAGGGHGLDLGARVVVGTGEGDDPRPAEDRDGARSVASR